MKQFNQNLIPLNNLNDLLNYHAETLMTIFETQCRKDWKPNRHLRVRRDNFETDLIITSNYNAKTRSSSFQYDNSLNFDSNTIIMAANKNEFILFFWKNRQNPSKIKHFESGKNSYIYNSLLEKDNDDINNGTIIQYREFKKKYDFYKYGELEQFKKNSLVSQMILFYKNDLSIKSKAGKVMTEKKRIANKAHGFKGKEVKLEFESPNGSAEDVKNRLEAYKIATTYGYNKTFMTFTRDLNKGDISLDKDSRHSLLISSLVLTPSIKNNIYRDCESKNLNNDECYYIDGVNTPEAEPKQNIKKDASPASIEEKAPKTRKSPTMRLKPEVIEVFKEIIDPEYQKYVDLCGENAYSYEEWLEMSKPDYISDYKKDHQHIKKTINHKVKSTF